MKNTLNLFLLFLGTVFYSPASTDEIKLIDNNTSNYKIVVSAIADKNERKAAEELQKYLQEISNVKLDIISDTETESEFEILIGNNNRLKSFEANLVLDSLGNDGFTIKTIGKKLLIVGGKEKGTLYGVYTFLEKYLNCRMYTPEALVIPINKNITIPKINITEIPKIKYRELLMPTARSQEFCDWHKLHHYSVRKRNYGLFVHTFNRLVPPNIYFKDHPEYFAEVNGIRIPDKQLCLTNKDVLNIVIKELKKRMKENPNAKIWSVSQNDSFGNCTCDACSKLDSIHQSPAGSLINFVNKVAKEFPYKTISTLAYQYTRKAPVGIKPEPNVMIVLCTIECDRNIPIEKNKNDSFNRDIKEWSALTNNLKIWDYVVQFRSYCDPFPNFRVLQPNLKMFVKHKVKYLFEQGSGSSKSDFHELKAYILAKLMWNPDEDVNAITNDFLNGYYGNAAKYIKLYLDKMHNALEASGKSLIIYGYPTNAMDSYLTPELIKEYNNLFDKAEQSVSDNSVFLQRVKIARLSLEYAILEISKRNPSKDLYIFKIENNKVTVNPKMKERLNNFVILANKAGIKRLHERGLSPDEYKVKMLNYFKDGLILHKAYKKNVLLLSKVSKKYLENKNILTDGIIGEDNYHFNWLGFEANEFEAVIDLQNKTVISSIRTNFLQEIKSWIWLPKKVEYFISQNGKDFTKIGEVKNKTGEKKSGIFIEPFQCNFRKTKARYIKVKTKSLIHCPKWHIGYNRGKGKAWLFIDEIVVK